MILCIGTTPAAQRVMLFPRLVLDGVNRASTTLEGAAGKSVNVAKVLKTLGEHPLAVGFLGGDRGANLRVVLEAKGIETDFLSVAATTRQCVTVIDESAGTVTELVEESRPATPADYEQLMSLIRRRVLNSRAVVLSGTITPGGPIDFYRSCAELAVEAAAMVFVDAHGPVLIEALKARPTLVKPNRAELAAMVAQDLRDEPSVLAAMRELQRRGAQRIVITAGKDPALAFDGQDAWRIRPPRLHVVNPTGSGDALTAGLVWRLLRGEDLGEACRWAAAAGGANALTPIPGELEFNEVERLADKVQVERV